MQRTRSASNGCSVRKHVSWLGRAGVATAVIAGLALGVLPSVPALADAQRVNEIIEGLQPRVVTRSLKGNQVSDTCYELIDTLDGVTRGATKAEIETVETCTQESPRLSFRITFRLGSSRLDNAAFPVLQELGTALEHSSFRDATFIVGGHTDARGTRDLNLRLSRERANAVRDYLVENFRVSGRQLRAIGYGFDNLAVAYDPYADENRRVEIVRLK